jgi:uncharacterized spore protein YtfJ
MIDTRNNFLSVTEKNSEQLRTMLEKLFAAAQPGAVYSEPVVAGNYTVITASEVTAGGGFGSGMGFGPATTPSTKKQPGEEASQPEEANSGGGGIGAGGGSAGRPVAIIIIGPDGVTVKPVFDITKIALAGITAWGAMFALLRRVRKASKG